jgi:sec-independent protein translocase protein TatB
MITPPPIQAANLGMWDSLILMVMALVVFGPRRLPEIGRQIGKLMYEVRKASNDFKFQMEDELRKAEDADRFQKEEARLRGLALTAPAETVAATSPYTEAKPETPALGSGGSINGELVALPYPANANYSATAEAPTETPASEAIPATINPDPENPGPTNPGPTNPVTEQAHHG